MPHVTLNALPPEACSSTELLTLATLQNIEKGLRKTWSQSSDILALLQRYAHVENWVGPIDNAWFQLRKTRSTVMTSVACKDPFPLPERRHGMKIGYSPKLYVDGIDSCVLDEMSNRGPGVLFNDLKEEMDAFKEDALAALNYTVVYGDGSDAPKHMNTADVQFANSFNGPAMETTFARGTGYGLLSILGDENLRSQYLTLDGADPDCAFWRAGIYDAEELSLLDPSDPDYWDGNLNFENLVRWLHLRKTPQSRYVAITDQETFLKIKLSVMRRLDVTNRNPVSGGTFDPYSDVTTIAFDGVIFVEDLYWPANSIGVFDFNEIYFKPVPEFWMKNTGWVAQWNNPLNKYLWEMWMYAIYTKRRNAHILICNPTITDYCSPVSICNVDDLGAAIAGAVGGGGEGGGGGGD